MTNNAVEGAAATAGIWLIMCYVLSIAAAVVIIISMFFIFRKAKTAGWKAFIPFVNILNYFNVMYFSDMFWGMFLTGGYLLAIGFIIPAGTLAYILRWVGLGIIMVFYLLCCLSGAKRFRKSAGFAVGMFFLPFVFLPILGFGKAQYYKE